jgi:hypothetical protein
MHCRSSHLPDWLLGFYRRLHDTEAILADIGLTFLVLGTLSLSCQNAVEDLANLNSFSLQGDTPKEVDSFLELLVAFTLPLGLAIYAAIRMYLSKEN